jgi:hypothetical protein
VGRERERARLGHRGVVGRVKEEERKAARVASFCFFFFKNINSNKFCLFCCELFRIPKMVKIIV